ncbi:hypothetical protein BKA66DRAFT_470322 [Pyrenochaeta sp. MPI-SDFR-AT-0127]|nr:hypothetical protein BKA66DRAFT_470322 [Pyrenochaeta sp. MPI-SDFR-AT-0127]
MNNIKRPAQVVVRQPYETPDHDDEEQLTAGVLFSRHELNRHRFLTWIQQYSSIPIVIKFPTVRMLENSWPNHTSLLPVAKPALNRQLRTPYKIALNTQIPIQQNTGILHQTEVLHEGAEDQDISNQGEQFCEVKQSKSATKKEKEPVDIGQAKHEKRQKEVLEVLEPMLAGENPDSTSLLLCWGTPDVCEIHPVKISLSADEVDSWHKIQREYYARRGAWKKCIPFYCVKKVSVVEVSGMDSVDWAVSDTNAHTKISIAGRNSGHRLKDTFIGSCVNEDLPARKKTLEQMLTDYEPKDFPCPYYPSLGSTVCFPECESWHADGFECPEARINSVERELLRLNMRRYLTLAFSTPTIATANDLLDDNLLISERDILSETSSWHCPSVGELKFKGLLIEEGWSLPTQHIVLLVATMVFFLIVLGARLLFDDWGVAWTVGCFFVALAALPKLWAGHTVG